MVRLDGSESPHIAPPRSLPATPRVTPRRIAVVLGVWAALAGGALGVAALLDGDPKPQVSLVAQPPDGLAPLRLFLDRDFPPAIASLPTATAQAEALQRDAVQSNDPARWVEFGALLHRAGNLDVALAAYRQALSLEPDRLDAVVGVQMVDGATGAEGLGRAAVALARLEERNPTSQLVAFNRGMVAIYRSDRDDIGRSFRRVLAIDPTTGLAQLARRFLAATNASTGSP